MSDPYRCRDGPATGCRQCGKAPEGRRRFYCSDECRDEFYRRHFWPQAAWHAAGLHGRRCVDCGGSWHATHHVSPLPHRPGRKANYNFNCGNHPDNLVPLCSKCHGRRHQELNAAKKRGAEPVRQLEISI